MAYLGNEEQEKGDKHTACLDEDNDDGCEKANEQEQGNKHTAYLDDTMINEDDMDSDEDFMCPALMKEFWSYWDDKDCT